MKDLLFGVIIGAEAFIDSLIALNLINKLFPRRSISGFGTDNTELLILPFFIIPIAVAILVGVASKFNNGYKLLKVFSAVITIFTICFVLWAVLTDNLFY